MNILYSIFVTSVWFLSTYFSIVLLLVILTQRSRIYKNPVLYESDKKPYVTILVPVYNEGEKVRETIDSLNLVDYPKDKLEVIVLNDGSKDNTSDVVNKRLSESDIKKNIIFVDNKKNKGKAATLNQGISLAKGEFVATMDGDSEVPSDILKKTVPFFKKDNVGAVTVTVEVKNPKTLLQQIVEIEYIIGLSLALKALSFFNAIHVTPGPFSVYRKAVLDKIEGFDADNITEDHEIALRIYKSGYRIENCTATKVKTISPGTFKELYVQRKRWYTGSLLTLWQHRDMMLRRKYGVFSFVYPYTYLLVTGGLLLFGYTIFLSTKNLFETLSFYSLTNYNFFSHLSLRNIDLLSISTLSILGVIAIITTVTFASICLRIARKDMKTRMPGFVGFVFLFFLYQIFWGSSLVSAITRRKVKWR
ncbi:MAG: glycosyltransferase [Nanoarchaeota archaeon]